MTIFGRNSIEEAINSNLKIKSILIDNRKKEKFENLIKLLKEKNIKLEFTNRPFEIDKIAKSRNHQGICAVIEFPDNIKEDINDYNILLNYKKILILDGITDTGNLGAIIRSAVLLNFDAVALPCDNSARITPQTIKSSAGGLYKINILYVNNINTSILTIKSNNWSVYGLDGHANNSISTIKFPEKLALCIGSEKEGLRKSVKKNCDLLVKIDMTNKLDSFNASVASAIAMWEVYKSERGENKWY